MLTEILQSDMENIRGTMESLDKDAFSMAAELIQNAKKIYIVGIRSCEPLADFLGFYLNMLFDEVHVVRTNSASEIFEQLMRIGAGDVLIGISFPKYSMRTVKAMELANSRSAGVISITDSIHSPLNLYSSCNLIARSEMASVVDSLTAPLSVINALIVALCLKNQDSLKQSIETLDQLYDDYQIYGRGEMDPSGGEIEIFHQGSRYEKEKKMKKVLFIGGGSCQNVCGDLSGGGRPRGPSVLKNEKMRKKLYTRKGRCNHECVRDGGTFQQRLQQITANFSTLRSMASPIRMRLPSSRRTARRPRWSGGEIFPLSDHSSDVIGSTHEKMRALGVQVHLNIEVKEILTEENKATGLLFRTERRKMGDVVILATGGLSYASTGSTATATALQKSWVIRSRSFPALVPMNVKEED